MIIIGSKALQHVFELPRPPKDIDYLCTLAEYEGFKEVFPNCEVLKDTPTVKALKAPSGQIYEFNIITTKSDKMIQEYVEKHTDGFRGMWIAPPGLCLAIKMSHRFKKDSPFFIKTMKDIHFLRRHGVKMNSHEKDIMNVRQQEVLSYKHPNLTVSKKEFFDDAMPYIYDHDTIHLAVALGKEPAYKSYMKDDSEVMTSKEKFFECPHVIQIAGVYEESCVLALERSLIPNKFRVDSSRAFQMALMKVCSSITSGWFREFAWEHYREVIGMYNRLGKEDYVERFKANQHLLKPFK